MNNPVSQIMFSSGDQAIKAKGSRVTALSVGQLGIFSYKTGLSIDSTSAIEDADEFFIAVGVDRNGDTVMDDVIQSAGQSIQMRNIRALTYRCYSASLPQTVDITDFTAMCNTEYDINIRLQVEKAYVDFGFNLPGFTYSYVTSCCNECGVGCPSGDCNELAMGLEAAINATPSESGGLYFANLLDYTTVPGTPVVVADGAAAAWIADPANAGKCLGIRITTVNAALASFVNGINLKYDYPRMPTLIVSLIQGFNCNGTVTVSQDAINEQGGVYDLKKIESDASGNNANGKGPFRTSQLIGVPFDSYQSTAGAVGSKYAQYILNYNIASGNGGSTVNMLTGLETIVAIPCADTTTRTSFVTAMDALTDGKYSPLLPADNECPRDCDTANVVSDLDDNTESGDSEVGNV